MLLVFGPLADRVAGILRSRPTPDRQDCLAPPEAMHAIAIFLYLSPEAAGSDAEVGDIIEQSDPRELLRMALPDCPARLYRALDRAGGFVRERSFYARVDAVCRGPFGSAFLDGGLTEMRLDFFEALPTMDTITVNLHAALSEMRHTANAVDTLVTLLRAYGTIGACDLRLPKNAGTGAVLRRLLRGLYAVRAPIPPFMVPAPLRLVETIGELRDIGRQFANCLGPLGHFGAKHWFDLADGSVVYLTTNEPPLLIALSRAGPSLWHIDQMSGPKSVDPPASVRRAIEQSLRGAGCRLVAIDPGRALCNLARAARPPKMNLNLDDDLGDLDD